MEAYKGKLTTFTIGDKELGIALETLENIDCVMFFDGWTIFKRYGVFVKAYRSDYLRFFEIMEGKENAD